MRTWIRDKENHLVSFDYPSTMGETKDDSKTIRELFSCITTNPPSCIVLPTTTAVHFELKPQIIHLLPTFRGLDREDPYMHVKDFLKICATCRISLMTVFTCIYSLFPWRIRQKHGLILCHLDLSLHGNFWSQNSSLNFSQWPRPMLWEEKFQFFFFFKMNKRNFMRVGRDLSP